MHGANTTTERVLTRRSLLGGARTALVAAVGVATLAGCASRNDAADAPPPEHPFAPLYRAAVADADQLDRLQAELPPAAPAAIAVALVAGARREHATALEQAMVKDGAPPTTAATAASTTAATTPAAPAAPATPAAPVPDIAALTQRLTRAADAAHDTAAADTGYRRALAAAISACCRAAATVVLAPHASAR